MCVHTSMTKSKPYHRDEKMNQCTNKKHVYLKNKRFEHVKKDIIIVISENKENNMNISVFTLRNLIQKLKITKNI